METVDYKDILRSELIKRCEKNQSYSLRAFSRDIGVTCSQLSRVLANKRHISYQTAKSVADSLFKYKKDKDFFVTLVEFSIAKKDREKELLLQKLMTISLKQKLPVKIKLNHINVLARWYNIAILEMFDLSYFQEKFKTAQDIATFLGIKEIEAKMALETLLSAGYISEKDGVYYKEHEKIAWAADIPNEVIRKFHKQMIEKAQISIDAQTVKERFLAGKTFTVSNKLIPEIADSINEFKNKVSEIINSEEKSQKNSVYQLNIQLFNLANKTYRRNK